MALSVDNANTVYEAIKAAGIRLIAALGWYPPHRGITRHVACQSSKPGK